MQTETSSINKLHALEALIQKGYKSDLVAKALNKLMELELAKLKRELYEIETRLNGLETKYNIDSDSFTEKYHAGSVEDSADNIEWISYVDMRMALIQQIRLLQEENT